MCFPRKTKEKVIFVLIVTSKTIEAYYCYWVLIFTCQQVLSVAIRISIRCLHSKIWWVRDCTLMREENSNYFSIDKINFTVVVVASNFFGNSWIEKSLKDKCALSTFCKILTIFLSNGCKELNTIVLLKIIEGRMRKVTRTTRLLAPTNVSLDNWKRRIGVFKH